MSANRAMRRAIAREEKNKSNKLITDMSAANKMAALFRNGITAEDLEKSFQQGFVEGGKQAGIKLTKIMYAAVALGLNEAFGFGQKRLEKALNCVDKAFVLCFNKEEIWQEVYEKFGLEFQDDEVFRVVQNGKPNRKKNVRIR